MPNNKLKNKLGQNSFWLNNLTPFVGFLLFALVTLLITFLFVWLSSSPNIVRSFGYKEVVDFGTAAGAVSALVIGVVSSYLVFISFQAQIRFNQDQKLILDKQREDFEEEKKRVRAYEDRVRIDAEIKYFLDEIRSLKYENYTGSDALFYGIMDRLGSLRRLTSWQRLSNKVKWAVISTQPIVLLCKLIEELKQPSSSTVNESFISILEMSSGWEKSIKQLKIKGNLIDLTPNKLETLIHLAVALKEERAEEARILYESFSILFKPQIEPNILSRVTIDELTSALNIQNFNFGHGLWEQFLASEEDSDSINISAVTFDLNDLKKNDLSISQIKLAEEPLINELREIVSSNYFSRIKFYFVEINRIINTIDRSVLGASDKLELLSRFEGIILLNFSREILHLNKVTNPFLRQVPHLSIRSIPKVFCSREESFNRYLRAFCFEQVKELSAKEIIISKYWIMSSNERTDHSLHFSSGRHDDIASWELLVRYPRSIDLFTQTTVSFLKKYPDKINLDKIKNAVPIVIWDFEKEEFNPSIILRLNAYEYSTLIRICTLKQLMVSVAEEMRRIEVELNMLFGEVSVS